jgi:hypothetical protein
LIRKLLKEIHLSISPTRVARRLGYNRANPASEKLKIEIENSINRARGLIEPRGIYLDLGIISGKNNRIVFENDFMIESSSVSKLLENCVLATFFAGTIGAEISNEIESLNSSENERTAFLLDTIGSECAEQLSRELQARALYRAKKIGMGITRRFSPGYGDFDLAFQTILLLMLGADEINLNCNGSFMLVPTKSITGVIGWNLKK